MSTCTAREFVETHGRTGSTDQFRIVARARSWALKADVWASLVPDSMIASEFAVVAAEMAFIAFPDLREEKRAA